MAGVKGHGGQPGRSGRKPNVTGLALQGSTIPKHISAPPELSSPAKREFRRVVKLLVERKQWLEEFRVPVAIYAQAWADWVVARLWIDRSELMTLSQKGEPQENPWLRIAERREERMLQVSTQMGLSLAGMARATRVHTRERIFANKDGAGIEREQWDEDLLG